MPEISKSILCYFVSTCFNWMLLFLISSIKFALLDIALILGLEGANKGGGGGGGGKFCAIIIVAWR